MYNVRISLEEKKSGIVIFLAFLWEPLTFSNSFFYIFKIKRGCGSKYDSCSAAGVLPSLAIFLNFLQLLYWAHKPLLCSSSEKYLKNIMKVLPPSHTRLPLKKWRPLPFPLFSYLLVVQNYKKNHMVIFLIFQMFVLTQFSIWCCFKGLRGEREHICATKSILKIQFLASFVG